MIAPENSPHIDNHIFYILTTTYSQAYHHVITSILDPEAGEAKGLGGRIRGIDLVRGPSQ